MGKVFYDLNVPVDDDTDETIKKVERLIRFGFQVIALNVSHTISSKKKRKKGESQDADESLSRKIKSQIERVFSAIKDKSSDIKILTRVTVVLDNPDQVRDLQNDFLQSFDIIAVRPTNEKIFLQACTQIEQIDVISLDLDEKIPFRFKYSTLGAAVERGIFIELFYASAIRSPSLRQNVLANSLNLVRKSKGRNIIFTSNAQHYMELRSPHDIANLGELFGLRPDQANEACCKACKSVVQHAYARKQTAKSVISMKKIGESISDIESIVKDDMVVTKNEDKIFLGEPQAKRKKKS